MPGLPATEESSLTKPWAFSGSNVADNTTAIDFYYLPVYRQPLNHAQSDSVD